jgi:hypothetical protein
VVGPRPPVETTTPWREPRSRSAATMRSMSSGTVTCSVGSSPRAMRRRASQLEFVLTSSPRLSSVPIARSATVIDTTVAQMNEHRERPRTSQVPRARSRRRRGACQSAGWPEDPGRPDGPGPEPHARSEHESMVEDNAHGIGGARLRGGPARRCNRARQRTGSWDRCPGTAARSVEASPRRAGRASVAAGRPRDPSRAARERLAGRAQPRSQRPDRRHRRVLRRRLRGTRCAAVPASPTCSST